MKFSIIIFFLLFCSGCMTRTSEQMNTGMVKAFIWHLDADGELGVGEQSDEIEERFEKLNIPLDLKRILQWDWPQKYSQIGQCLEWYDAESILNEHWNNRLEKWSMIMIGKAGNGDALVIHYGGKSCPVGFIRFTTFARSDATKKESYFQIEDSLDRFFFRAAEGLYIPCDSYDCEDWGEFKKNLVVRYEDEAL